MTILPANAVRFGLRLLLAACLLLQATASLAMATAMEQASGMAMPRTASTMAPAPGLPPCHAALVEAADPAPMHPAPMHGGAETPAQDCCDEGSLCHWACAQAPPLASPCFVLATASLSAAPSVPRTLPPPHGWPVSTPLRPPIA